MFRLAGSNSPESPITVAVRNSTRSSGSNENRTGQMSRPPWDGALRASDEPPRAAFLSGVERLSPETFGLHVEDAVTPGTIQPADITFLKETTARRQEYAYRWSHDRGRARRRSWLRQARHKRCWDARAGALARSAQRCRIPFRARSGGCPPLHAGRWGLGGARAHPRLQGPFLVTPSMAHRNFDSARGAFKESVGRRVEPVDVPT